LPSPDNTGFLQISHNSKHSAFITGNGSLFVFGASTHGQLGLGEVVQTNILNDLHHRSSRTSMIVKTPKRVDTLSDVRCLKVSCGLTHTGVVTENGEVWTWGFGGSKWGFECGGLGHGNKETISIPKKVNWFKERNIRAVDIACGDNYTSVVDDKGFIYAFGEGEHGRLGTGKTSSAKIPELLEFFTLSKDTLVSKVWVVKDYTIAQTKDYSLYGWGRNDKQQLGLGGGLAMDIYSCETSPQLIPLQNGIIDISLSSSDCVAITEDNRILTWGDRRYLEPTEMTEIFPDELIERNFYICGSGLTYQAYVLMDGTLWTCNKRISISSDMTCNGHGYIDPHKEPKQVKAINSYIVTDLVCHDNKISVLVE